MSSVPKRLALQTGELDDSRREITPDDELWDAAYRSFARHDGGPDADELRSLCERWPAAGGPATEALAVTVALASPFAARDRILHALSQEPGSGSLASGASRSLPVVVSPWTVQRPHFPHIYDPDAEQRAPIVAILDGPCSPEVGRLLEKIKREDHALADAIVLGADLDTLESLDRLIAEARTARREPLAAKVEQDRARWRLRAEQARARQRLESAHYGWHSDNFPPGCIDAFRVELRRDVDAQLAPRSAR